MPIVYDEFLARRVEDHRTSYDDTRTLLYNLSVGMGRDPLDEAEFPFIFEQPDFRVVPTAASILGGAGSGVLRPGDLDMTMIVHGEQRLVLHRPLPAAADLVVTSYFSELVDKGKEKGALVTVTNEVRLASGEPLYEADMTMFARGDGGFGGPRQSRHAPHQLPEREPDMVHVTQIRPDQAALYRLNGDRNPLHIEPGFAKRAGFPRPILHGLCSYGLACRAILASVCDYDPARIAQFDVRFSSPVYPGEMLQTEIWIDGEVISYRCRVADREVIVLNNGRCVLNGV